MSVDAVARTIKKDIALFAFLPVTNSVYLLIERQDTAFLKLSILSLFVSSMIYNYLRAETGNPDSFQRIILAVVSLFWTSTFFFSIYHLYMSFSSGEFIPEILFSISILFSFLIITDRIWNSILDDYDGIL